MREGLRDVDRGCGWAGDWENRKHALASSTTVASTAQCMFYAEQNSAHEYNISEPKTF